MSIAEVERQSELRLEAAITGTPIDKGQPSFQKPKDHGAYLRHVVLGGIETALDINNTSYEAVGIIAVQVFTPADAGRRANATLYDTVAAVYRNVAFGGVLTLDPNRVVVDPNGGYRQSNMLVEWSTETIT